MSGLRYKMYSRANEYRLLRWRRASFRSAFRIFLFASWKLIERDRLICFKNYFWLIFLRSRVRCVLHSWINLENVLSSHSISDWKVEAVDAGHPIFRAFTAGCGYLLRSGSVFPCEFFVILGLAWSRCIFLTCWKCIFRIWFFEMRLRTVPQWVCVVNKS